MKNKKFEINWSISYYLPNIDVLKRSKKLIQTLQSIYCFSKSPNKDKHINAQYKNMKWKKFEKVEIILWKEQRDRGRKEISEERRREVEEIIL